MLLIGYKSEVAVELWRLRFAQYLAGGMRKGELAARAVCSLHQAVFLELGVEIAGNAIEVIFPLYHRITEC